MSSSFGTLFRISTFGESHGGAVGVLVDGCPARLALDEADVQRDLDRRRPGQNRFTTPRQEEDRVEIVSGVFEGRTLGSPIAMLVRNTDARPSAYEEMKDLFRPSHADFTYEAKYGLRNWQGGGRASARETIGRVAAAAVARKLLREAAGIEVQVGDRPGTDAGDAVPWCSADHHHAQIDRTARGRQLRDPPFYHRAICENPAEQIVDDRSIVEMAQAFAYQHAPVARVAQRRGCAYPAAQTLIGDDAGARRAPTRFDEHP